MERRGSRSTGLVEGQMPETSSLERICTKRDEIATLDRRPRNAALDQRVRDGAIRRAVGTWLIPTPAPRVVHSVYRT